MYKIAVMGDYDSIYGFATLGLSICPVKARDEAKATLQIPGVSGNTGAGVEGVKKTVEQAVGSDILFGGVSE